MEPCARQEQLLVEEAGDELVVYDQERQQAHRLNRTAALVWQHCDGKRTPKQMATLLQKELNPEADETLVWVTLDRLSGANLLQAPLQRSREQARASRRQFVRKVGMVGALSLMIPVITTIVAPTPAQAQSQGTGCCECACECFCICITTSN
jgi:hypothetical protein